MKLRQIMGMSLLVLVVYLHPLNAGTVSINFDNLPDSTPVRTSYQNLNVSFVRATAITAAVSLNEFEFPPHSGGNVAFDNTGNIVVNFSSPVFIVGAYFTYSSSITLRAFDANGALLGTTTSSFSNNEALSGEPGSSPNEFLQVRSSTGISLITITGAPSGSSFAMDDFTFSDTLDTTPPVTVALPSIPPNANGWNNTSVTVSLNATDNEPGGTGVKEIHWNLTGAQTGSSVVAASTASVTIANEGATTLTYFAIDNAGNAETPKTLTLQIDKTPPVLSGLPQPGTCVLWPPNHKLVAIGIFSASDTLSGLDLFTVTGTSNESTDSSDIVITGSGLQPRSVQLRAERLGSGTGRTYMLQLTARDLAGNLANTTVTCVVPHDQGK